MDNTDSGLLEVGIPVVRHFIACERIEVASSGAHYSLVNVIYAIRALPGVEFPRIHPQLALFVQLTDGRGSHSFRLQVVFVENEKSTYTTAPATLELGNDPLVVHGWPIRLNNILFERAGLYEIRLLCDGQTIAREPILLRESS